MGGAAIATRTERDEAVSLAIEHGSFEAARRSGFSAGTIRKWAQRDGVRLPVRQQLQPLVHGTVHGYQSWLCRCVKCRGARSADAARHRRARVERLPEVFDRLPHGSVSTYENWGCRCEPCKAAKVPANARGRRRRKAVL